MNVSYYMAILREKSAVGSTLYINTLRKNSINGNIVVFLYLQSFPRNWKNQTNKQTLKKKQVNLNVCVNERVASFSLMFGR